MPPGVPALRGQSAPGNLPSLPTGFVGRARELAAVGAALAQPDVRLLTLTGPGGSGKTRLALEAAARNADRIDGGTFFVPLAPVDDAAVVAPTIAEALGLREIGERQALDLLKRHLGDRRALLVLDNFEQVHDAGSLLSELLSAAPGLRMLVTSRSPVRAYGEHELPVRPMAVPEPGADARTIAASEAVELFVQRASAVLPGFALTQENASDVADIVARIDGLPLAIGLAASRVRLLSLHELAARLGSRLRLLTGGANNLPDRQRTLRATIDWSYQLLDGDEQTLFRRLSCFVGGCTIESAAAVADPTQELPFDVLDGIASLIDKSLLWRQESAAGTTRFHMLETLQEYAREQLNVEHDNVLAALDWAVASDADGGEIALQLVTAMGWYWYTRGHAQVAALWLERALERGANAPTQLRAKPLYWFGAILDRRGDLERARDAMEASVEAWRTVGDLEKLATALNGLGSAAENQGDHATARAAYEESLAGYRKLAWVVLEQGRRAEAAALAHDATKRFPEWREQSYLAACLDLHAALVAPTRPRQAARLLGAACALRDTLGASLPQRESNDLERHMAPVRLELADAFDELYDAGAAAELDDVLDEVLADSPTP